MVARCLCGNPQVKDAVVTSSAQVILPPLLWSCADGVACNGMTFTWVRSFVKIGYRLTSWNIDTQTDGWWFHKRFLGAFAKLRKATVRFVMSGCPFVRPSAWKNSSPTGRIFTKFDIWGFFENLSRKFTLYQNLTRITSTLHEVRYTRDLQKVSALLYFRGKRWGREE